jgi:hypothetical protein
LDAGAFLPASGLAGAAFLATADLADDALFAATRAVLFPTAPEATAFATFFPGAGWREGARCAVFLRIGFFASGAIQILPGPVR